MIVPDVNLLIYAHNEQAPEHDNALDWWTGLLAGTEAIGLPWAVSTGFVRVISNPSAVRPPLTTLAAVDQVQSWLEYDHVTPIQPGASHLEYFRRNLTVQLGGPNLVPDAHIAALALEYDAKVHSADTDFGRFPGVRWRNPLA